MGRRVFVRSNGGSCDAALVVSVRTQPELGDRTEVDFGGEIGWCSGVAEEGKNGHEGLEFIKSVEGEKVFAVFDDGGSSTLPIKGTDASADGVVPWLFRGQQKHIFDLQCDGYGTALPRGMNVALFGVPFGGDSSIAAGCGVDAYFLLDDRDVNQRAQERDAPHRRNWGKVLVSAEPPRCQKSEPGAGMCGHGCSWRQHSGKEISCTCAIAAY